MSNQGPFKDNDNTIEKRAYKRFKPGKDAYIALLSDSVKVGRILNISKSGLAFSYISEDEQINDYNRMNIFLSGNRFYLKELPFNVISDFYIGTETPFSKVLMKQCTVQFRRLTSRQISQLEYFIVNHTED
jgi:hypothetical protein